MNITSQKQLSKFDIFLIVWSDSVWFWLVDRLVNIFDYCCSCRRLYTLSMCCWRWLRCLLVVTGCPRRCRCTYTHTHFTRIIQNLCKQSESKLNRNETFSKQWKTNFIQMNVANVVSNQMERLTTEWHSENVARKCCSTKTAENSLSTHHHRHIN